MTDDYTADWVLPPGVTLQQAQANPGTEFAFPQTLTTTDTAPCGSVIQYDVYNADPSSVTADGVLSWVDGRPEDSTIYVSHIFFETPACPPPLVCPEGTVPGWLDESGNPTSCVSDNPDPTPPPTVTETPVPPIPPVLAETGISTGEGFMWALALVAWGVAIFCIRRIIRGKR